MNLKQVRQSASYNVNRAETTVTLETTMYDCKITVKVKTKMFEADMIVKTATIVSYNYSYIIPYHNLYILAS